MKVIRVARAGGPDIDPVMIRIEAQVPDFGYDDLATKAPEWYQDEADKLTDALYNHLPGATLDRLTANLLIKQASLFRVSFGSRE